jgi:predicted nucleic acid-binding protein
MRTRIFEKGRREQDVGCTYASLSRQLLLQQAFRQSRPVARSPDEDLIARGAEIMSLGVKKMDALHLACAESAACDWFFTLDRGILKKVQRLGEMRVANPIEFVLEELS